MSAIVYPVSTDQQREAAVAAVQQAVQGGRTVVIPTDTVYGIAADAFSQGGVQQLLAAKGRSRRMPPPVLLASAQVLPGVADELTEDARALAEAFWPGALTLVVYAQPSLRWDLGETHGTVALRVPDDAVAREILQATGPLAVSSANRTGQTAATDAQEAVEQLGERVELVVDAGRRPADRPEEVPSSEVLPSTIVDTTGEVPVVVRLGAIGLERLRAVVPSVVTLEQWQARAEQEDTAEEPVADADLEQHGTDQDRLGGTESTSAGERSTDRAAAIDRDSAAERDAAPNTDGQGTDGQGRSVPEAAVALSAARPAGAVDQRRTREAPAAGSSVRPASTFRPLPAEEARRLVAGTAPAPAEEAAESPHRSTGAEADGEQAHRG